jgi:hypothetical protein
LLLRVSVLLVERPLMLPESRLSDQLILTLAGFAILVQ